MIVLGTLLLVLLVISEGRTKLDCKCADDSKVIISPRRR